MKGLIVVALMVTGPAFAQSKFFSTPNRGGAEGAKQNVMLSVLQNEQQRMNACTAAGLIYAPTSVNANTDGCTSAAGQREFSGDVTVGGSSTVSGSLTVGGELSVSGPVTLPTGVGIGSGPATTALDVAGAIRVAGESEVCNAERAGAIRYNASIQSMEFCNGTAWGGMAGGGSVQIATGAVSACRSSSVAACPAGTRVVSGGYVFQSSCGCDNVYRFATQDRPYGNGWIASIECGTTIAYALCATQ